MCQGPKTRGANAMSLREVRGWVPGGRTGTATGRRGGWDAPSARLLWLSRESRLGWGGTCRDEPLTQSGTEAVSTGRSS